MKKLLRAVALLTTVFLLMSLPAIAEEAELSDWYLERADKLVAGVISLCASDAYFETYAGGAGDVKELVDSWRIAMEAGPVSVQKYKSPWDSLLADYFNIMDLPEAARTKLERSAGTLIVNMAAGEAGVNFLSASAMFTLDEGYLMPDNFIPLIVLYEYEGVCAAVSFAQSGEGVVRATLQLCPSSVKNYLVSAEKPVIGGALMDGRK